MSESKKVWRNRAILAAAVLFAAGVFLLYSARFYKIGFPLDDAWIHQTYARNLAVLGEWSFIPGRPSAGSTAPLWSFLLAVGYWLRIGYLFWAFLLGFSCLLGLAMVGERFFSFASRKNGKIESRVTVVWFVSGL